MKHSAKCLSWIIAVILIGNCCVVDAAYTDSTAPYTGQYMLIYNSVTSSGFQQTGTLNSSVMSVQAYGEAALNSSDESAIISGTDIIDGKLYYQAEPVFNDFDPSSLNIASNSSMQNDLMTADLAIGDTRNFYAVYALDSNSPTYTVISKLMVSGTYCNVYVEKSYVDNSTITMAKAEAVAAEFDSFKLSMETNFGSNLTNDDSKIDILLHDIKEHQVPISGENIYVAGYFSPQDLYPVINGGNACAMIHIDIPQLMYTYSGYNVENGYPTLIHEFQHLINFTDTLEAYDNTGVFQENELWMNEMMSMAAQHMFYTPLYDRISSYYNSIKVRDGAVLTYSSYSTNGYTDLGANYGLPYLFGQYLRVQTSGLTGSGGAQGGDGIYKQILESTYTDYHAVTEALNTLGYGVSDFDRLQENFRIATFLNEAFGYYGFCGDTDFDGVHAPLYTGSGTSLAPGAAIITSLASGSYTPAVSTSASFLTFSPNTVGIKVYDEAGDSALALTSGQTLSVLAYSLEVQETSAPVLVAALYSSTGKMLRLWSFSGTSGNAETQASLTLPTDVQNCRLKIFYMGNTANVAPLCDTYALN